MLGGISQAATYIWSGAANNGIYGDSGNWTVNGSPNGYYPQHSANDDAVIGQMRAPLPGQTARLFSETPTPSRSVPEAHWSAVRPRGISMSTPSPWKAMPIWFLNQRTLLGWACDFTLNFGTFTASEHGSWTATDIANLWVNHHSVHFTGTLDMNSLTGSGTIELASIKSDQWDGPLTLDLSGLNIASTSQVQANVTQVTENGVTKVIINYETVPEPATFSGHSGVGRLALETQKKITTVSRQPFARLFPGKPELLIFSAPRKDRYPIKRGLQVICFTAGNGGTPAA